MSLGTDQKKALQDELEKLRTEFTVDTEQLKKITKRFQEELEEGTVQRFCFFASFKVMPVSCWCGMLDAQ